MSGYSLFTTQIAAAGPYNLVDATSAAPFQASDAAINNILPQMIAYAEGRIYREPEFDFMATYTTDVTQTTTANSRLVPIPATFLIVDSVNIITPAGATIATSGAKRTSLKRTTLDFLDFVQDQSIGPAAQGLPAYYAIYEMDQATPSAMRLAPTPNAAYQMEFLGTFTPPALSATNTDTFLTTYLPDLFFAASMIFLAGYQRNFGAQSDDPRMAASWEQEYAALKQGAAVTEARKHSRGPSYSPDPPMPLVAPPQLPPTTA